MITLLRLLARFCFRFRACNAAVLATPGPMLLVPNHVSWIDWLSLVTLRDPDWRFVTSAFTAQSSWLHRRMRVNDRTFPVDHTSPYAVRDMADYREKGGRLVLFAEGRITLTGSLMKVYDGTGFLIRKTGAKVITCYLRGAIKARGLSNLSAPREIRVVTSIPKLGTGKTNHRELERQLSNR